MKLKAIEQKQLNKENVLFCFTLLIWGGGGGAGVGFSI